jgi:hypothetical protein
VGIAAIPGLKGTSAAYANFRYINSEGPDAPGPVQAKLFDSNQGDF